MSSSRKVPHLGSNVSRSNAKIYKFLREAKAELEPTTYSHLLDILSTYESEPAENYGDTLNQVEDALQTSTKLTQSLNSMIPEQYHIGKIKYTEAVDFVDQIKEKAHTIYQPFIDTLKKYQNGEMALDELVSSIEVLMKPFPDLLENFRLFIPTMGAAEQQPSPSEEVPEEADGSYLKSTEYTKVKREPAEPQPRVYQPEAKTEKQEDVSPAPGRSESEAEDASQFGMQENNEHYILRYGLKAMFPEPKLYKDIFKTIQIYTLGIINIHELEGMIEDIFLDGQAGGEKEKLVKLMASRNSSRRMHTWCCRASSDLATAKCERIESYLLLPEEYPAVIGTGRDPKLSLELNDKWVSVASGSEDFSFKVTRKNPYEEALCKCEDERFEMDMAINYCDYAIEYLEKLLVELPAIIDGGDLLYAYRKCSEGCLHRQLRRIFADSLDSVLEQVKVSPQPLVEAMLRMVNGHRDKHIQNKREQNRQWKEVCEKNNAKSLDHRAFYFKQSEKKNTNAKAFMLEIKSRYDKRAAETTAELVKKGGTATSVYYNSVPMLVPESFHTVPVEHDDIAHMSSADVKKYAGKLPQFQLLFDRNDTFVEAYKLISDQIASVLSGQPEKEKTKALLNKLMVDFFCFDPAQTTPDSQEESNEGFSEEDVRAAMADCFIGKRLEHGEQSLAESWARLREEVMAIEAKSGEDNKAAESKKAKPTRPQKNTRGGHTKKADKKGEGNGKGVTMFERGLARAGIREFGEPMELLQQKGKRMEDALFLPIANSERCSVMYGTANFYSFFRHFHCLYERLIKARNFAGKGFDGDLEKKPELAARFASVLGRRVDEFKAERYEQIFTKGLYAYLKGTIDTARYEDFCRHTLGPQAYLLFTMDKLINSIVKIVQNKLLEEEVSNKVMDLYNQQKQQKLPEIIYYTYYNRLIIDVPAGSTSNTFRAFYNPLAKVLSIHYCASPYAHLDYVGLKQLHRYVDVNVVGSGSVHTPVKAKVFLRRNLKATGKRAERAKRVGLSNQISHINMGETNGWKMLYGTNGEDLMLLHGKRVAPEDERLAKQIEGKFGLGEWLCKKKSLS